MCEICIKIFNKSENHGIARKFRGDWENFAVQGAETPLETMLWSDPLCIGSSRALPYKCNWWKSVTMLTAHCDQNYSYEVTINADKARVGLQEKKQNRISKFSEIFGLLLEFFVCSYVKLSWPKEGDYLTIVSKIIILR